MTTGGIKTEPVLPENMRPALVSRQAEPFAPSSGSRSVFPDPCCQNTVTDRLVQQSIISVRYPSGKLQRKLFRAITEAIWAIGTGKKNNFLVPEQSSGWHNHLLCHIPAFTPPPVIHGLASQWSDLTSLQINGLGGGYGKLRSHLDCDQFQTKPSHLTSFLNGTRTSCGGLYRSSQAHHRWFPPYLWVHAESRPWVEFAAEFD